MCEEPAPAPGAGEVQIQVKSVGVCASDLHYYRDGRIGSTLIETPLVIGHEASGVVSALGEGVTGLRVGDRVAIEPAKPCGKCEYCLSGHFNVCPDVPFFGTPPTDGCFRDYITWPAALVFKVPDSLSLDEVAMVEPLAVGIYAVQLADLRAEYSVVVLGAGAIGLSVMQAARVAGVRQIIVSDPVEARRALASRLGASKVIDPSLSNIDHEISRFTDGRGADVVFECAGDESAVREASRIAKPLGRMVIVGIPDGDIYSFDASSARRKELTAVFVRRSNNTTETGIKWTAEGKVDTASYATHRFALEEAKEAMELAISKADGVIRAIIAVSE